MRHIRRAFAARLAGCAQVRTNRFRRGPHHHPLTEVVLGLRREIEKPASLTLLRHQALRTCGASNMVVVSHACPGPTVAITTKPLILFQDSYFRTRISRTGAPVRRL